ncbi:MAG: FHA domain-containing protein, partial [Verrucomicrobiota bacterium]
MAQKIELEIRRPGKDPETFEIGEGTFTIGSESDCAIRLANKDVEPRHAILAIRSGSCRIEDLDSESGTFLDGTRINRHSEMRPGQRLGVGPFEIIIKMDHRTEDREAGNHPGAAESPSPDEPASETTGNQPEPEAAAPSASPAGQGNEDEKNKKLKKSIKQQIHKELVERLDIKRLTASRIKQEDLQEKALSNIRSIVKEVSNRLPPGLKAEELVEEIYNEALRLGPLEDFLADPEVTEIMVNGPDNIYVEKGGKRVRTDRNFMDSSSVLAI